MKHSFTTDISKFIDLYYQKTKTYNVNEDLFKQFAKLSSVLGNGNIQYKTNINRVSSFSELINELQLKLTNFHSNNYYKEKKLIIIGNDSISNISWSRVVTIAELNTLITDYFYHYSIINDKLVPDKTKYSLPAVTLNYYNNGNSVIGGKYVIPGLYTNNAINVIIKPLVNKYSSLINSLKNTGVNTDIIENEFNKLMSKYTNTYISNYQNYLSALKYNIKSKDDLALLLNILNSSKSPITNILNIVYENTSFDVSDNINFLKPINKAFQNLNKLTVQANRSLSEHNKQNSASNINELEVYNQIIDELYMSLSFDKTPNQYQDKITIQNIVKNIAMGNNDSFLLKVKHWLNSTNIPYSQRVIFTKPITTVYHYGLPILKNQLQNIWASQLQPILDNANRYFPFKQSSKVTISQSELMNSFSTTGTFWILYDKYFSSYFVKAGRNIVLKDKKLLNDLISPSIQSKIQKVNNLKNSLWDKKGNPKNLIFSIEPTELPEQNIVGNKFVKLVSLQAGENSIITINTVPTWQNLRVPWIKANASANVVFTEGNTFANGVEQSGFSFLKFIQKGYLNPVTNIVSWVISTPGITSNNKVVVTYKFASNPFNIFKI